VFKRLRKKSIFLVFTAILFILAVVYAEDVPVFQSPTDNPETKKYDGKITCYFGEYHRGIDIAIGSGAKNGMPAIIAYKYGSSWVGASTLLNDSGSTTVYPET